MSSLGHPWLSAVLPLLAPLVPAADVLPESALADAVLAASPLPVFVASVLGFTGPLKSVAYHPVPFN